MPRTIWDDPFNEDNEKYAESHVIETIRKSEHIDVSLIRARQRKLLPCIEQMRDTAREVLRRYDPLYLNAAERHVFMLVDYRLPDHPHLLQTFGHTFSDHAVLAPVKKNESSATADLFAPPRPVDEVKGHGHLSELFKLEGIAMDTLPEKVRIIYPSLLKFVAFWVKEIEGPINRVRFNERPVNTRYMNILLSQYRH